LALGLASNAAAWEYTPGTPCLLRHETATAVIELTHDVGAPLYSLIVKSTAAFDRMPHFGIRFHGSRPLQNSTDRHVFSADRRLLKVVDSGFSNVLNGLQFNQSAILNFGTSSVEVSLENAAAPVAAFRACDMEPAV
jgi:hypothetical protein